MPEALEIRVPNIGDFRDVPIVDVLVKAGDTVGVEDPLVAIESEKATMEVPSPYAGVVQSVAVKIGDKVSEGSALLRLTTAAAGESANASSASESANASPAGESANASPAGESANASPATESANASPVGETANASPASETANASNATAHAGASADAANARSGGGGEDSGTHVVELRVPDLGDFADIPVTDVLITVGDRVELETSLVTLESEKAAMDVPANAAGIVREVKVKVGDRVSQGTLVALLESTQASSTPPPAAANRVVVPAQEAAPAAASAPPAATPRSPAGPAHGAGNGAVAPAPEAAASADAVAANGVVHASPSIRRFARELGVDLRSVRGTGPHERITREDVQNFVKTALAVPAGKRSAGTGPFDLPPWPIVDFAKFGAVESVPLSRIRKLSGPNLHRNWVSIPHVTNNEEADITDLEAFRKKLNAENPAAKLTMLAFVIKAAVVALRAHPDVNSSLDGESLVRKKYYNIGFAADTPGGLVVPVLKGADGKGLLAIAVETAALAARAREGKLAMSDMQGATFTISSLGGIGGTSFTPIVNAPEVAILGLSRAALRPVWDGAAFVPRLMLPLSLSYDHRVVDGALAARFNATLAAALGDLRRALL